MEPGRNEDIEWCVRLARSPAVLWRATEHPLVRETRWYRDHERDAPAAILDVIRAAPCRCGCGIEITASALDPPDAGRLARGMAEAVVECAMESELNGHAPAADARSRPRDGRPRVRVMISNDDAQTR